MANISRKRAGNIGIDGGIFLPVNFCVSGLGAPNGAGAQAWDAAGVGHAGADCSGDRGRNEDCSSPPAQIRTGPIKAFGSYLGCFAASTGQLLPCDFPHTLQRLGHAFSDLPGILSTLRQFIVLFWRAGRGD